MPGLQRHLALFYDCCSGRPVLLGKVERCWCTGNRCSSAAGTPNLTLDPKPGRRPPRSPAPSSPRHQSVAGSPSFVDWGHVENASSTFSNTDRCSGARHKPAVYQLCAWTCPRRVLFRSTLPIALSRRVAYVSRPLTHDTYLG